MKPQNIRKMKYYNITTEGKLINNFFFPLGFGMFMVFASFQHF